MNIRRIADSIIAKLFSSKKILLVLGARQVGKTTLVENNLGQHKSIILNFDVEIDKRRFLAAAELSPAEALKSFGSPEVLVLDEAQRLPSCARIVKGWHDVHLPVKILLLGSSSLDLLSQAAESLTGRNEKLLLPPLLFEESIRSQSWYSEEYPQEILLSRFAEPLQSSLMQSMVFGAYPEVVTSGDKMPLLRNLSSDYLWKDILQTGLVKTPDLIKRLLMLLAHQAGSEVSINELAAQLQTSRPTVERYIELLEQTFVVFRLPAFSTNPRKEIAKNRKIYFWDTGIRNALLNQFSADPLRPDIGALWENWAIAEVAKLNMLNGGSSELFFWRSRAQSEVDLVVRTGNNLKAFELKWRRKQAGSRAFRDQYGVEVNVLTAENPFVGRTVLGA